MLMQPENWWRSARKSESERHVDETELNDALVGMLILPSQQLERSQRWARHSFAGLTALAPLLYLATWLAAANTLWAARQLGDWFQFWDAYKFHITMVAFLGSVYGLTSVMGAINHAPVMRRAIEASDATIAPIAPDQPLPPIWFMMWPLTQLYEAVVPAHNAAAQKQHERASQTED